VALKDIDLSVKAGEVVAIAGVAGNGQSELFDVLSGEERVSDADAIRIRGSPRAEWASPSGGCSAAASCRKNGTAMRPLPNCR
jgi:ABC-type uncharacterized transport system ATPase subunit